jgi:hypothetical protein
VELPGGEKHTSLLDRGIVKTFKLVSQGPYSKHLFKWAKLAVVLHFANLERLVSAKHSSLLDPFLNYEEKRSVVNTSP